MCPNKFNTREEQQYDHTLMTDYETRFLGDGTDYSEMYPTEAFGSPAHADREYRTLDLPILQQVGPT
jgi:hypothetical protein